jgi:hypothetical protein
VTFDDINQRLEKVSHMMSMFQSEKSIPIQEKEGENPDEPQSRKSAIVVSLLDNVIQNPAQIDE